MSSIKCVGAVAAAGALVSGGFGLYKGIKTRNAIIDNAQRISKVNGGKIPTGGMTKDGKLWDGFTTVDKVKKDTKKGVVLGTIMTTIAGAVSAAVIAAATLLINAKIK